jgi:hypothetical protein
MRAAAKRAEKSQLLDLLERTVLQAVLGNPGGGLIGENTRS